ncbi:MAG: primosomal protein N' (replication factor Y) - superfamily II helicase [Thiotrichaceae bacterium]|nr:primosomal protein N' (replication factor Y) - superfamily II helicase [Thiotrichaceae bacterium]
MKIKHYHEDKASEHHDFPCGQCGAELTYAIGTNHLLCNYCGHTNIIEVKSTPIEEYDLHSALEELSHLEEESTNVVSVLNCPSCGAKFSLNANEHAGDCPFCSAPAVVSHESTRHIHPESLLPFKLTEVQALKIFDRWISSRWFAPSALKNASKRDDKMVGIYLPYWTYDSQTETRYQGLRGTTYYDRQVYTTVENGRTVRRVRNVPRIRWRTVQGHVSLYFDDVLIGASETLPRVIIDNLQPWDLSQLIPYSEHYISGFRSEIYQVSLNQGFNYARARMDSEIKRKIKVDIGGDQQRISSKHTDHSETTFKHLLLPVWSAAFRYKKKTYRFVINGRNGKIQGERPYSVIKITLFSIFIVAIILSIIFLLKDSNIDFSSLQMDYNYPTSGHSYGY